MCRHGKVLIPSPLYPTPSQNWIYKDERKEMMKSEGCISVTNVWVVQWKAPGFFSLKVVPFRIKMEHGKCQGDLSRWSQKPLSVDVIHQQPVTQARGREHGSHVLASPLCPAGRKSSTGLSPKEWQAWCKKRRWSSLCGLWGSTGPWKNRRLSKQSLSLCPTTLRLVAWDR